MSVRLLASGDVSHAPASCVRPPLEMGCVCMDVWCVWIDGVCMCVGMIVEFETMRQCIDVAILILMLWPTGGLIAVDDMNNSYCTCTVYIALVFNAVGFILLPIKVGLATRSNTSQ